MNYVYEVAWSRNEPYPKPEKAIVLAPGVVEALEAFRVKANAEVGDHWSVLGCTRLGEVFAVAKECETTEPIRPAAIREVREVNEPAGPESERELHEREREADRGYSAL
jgi:hypothetical protein